MTVTGEDRGGKLGFDGPPLPLDGGGEVAEAEIDAAVEGLLLVEIAGGQIAEQGQALVDVVNRPNVEPTVTDGVDDVRTQHQVADVRGRDANALCGGQAVFATYVEEALTREGRPKA